MDKKHISLLRGVVASSALLFLMAACGPSSVSSQEQIKMFIFLGFDLVEGGPDNPRTDQEALTNQKIITDKLGLFISNEICGDTKDKTAYTGSFIGYFITIPKSQVDLAKTIGYEIYIEEEKWNYFPCPY